jgi:hypothetical protein
MGERLEKSLIADQMLIDESRETNLLEISIVSEKGADDIFILLFSNGACA